MRLLLLNIRREIKAHYAGYGGRRGLLTLSSAMFLLLYFAAYFVMLVVLDDRPALFFSEDMSGIMTGFSAAYAVTLAVILPLSMPLRTREELSSGSFKTANGMRHGRGVLLLAKYSASGLICLKTAIPAFIGACVLAGAAAGSHADYLNTLVLAGFFAAACVLITVVVVSVSVFDTPVPLRLALTVLLAGASGAALYFLGAEPHYFSDALTLAYFAGACALSSLVFFLAASVAYLRGFKKMPAVD